MDGSGIPFAVTSSGQAMVNLGNDPSSSTVLNTELKPVYLLTVTVQDNARSNAAPMETTAELTI